MTLDTRRPARLSVPGSIARRAVAALPFVSALILALPARAVPIGDLHCNDPNGAPLAPYTNGTVVTVTGILTVGTGTYDLTYTDLYVQDATGGIEVYRSGIPAAFAPGDSLTVTGTIGQFNANTEIVMTSATVHATGLPVPPPLVLTCNQVFNTWQTNSGCGANPANGREANEGRLIRINGVTWSGTWPTPGTNGTVTLTDASGSCTLFIDKDTGVDDMSSPVGTFNLVGILKQYDTTVPLTSGYQIVPRSPGDFLFAGPRIVDGPRETDIRSDRVTIVWTTDVPATSRVDYGRSIGYELGSIIDPTLTTDHIVTLPNLTSAKLHHYRVQTQDSGGGLTITGDELFCSGSGPESTGEIRVYFNKVVDTSLSLGTPAQGLVNLPGRLVERINAAQYSIDFCIYSFDLASVADALIAAKNRGVAVRFIYDNRDGGPYQDEVVRLIANGITVIDDSYGVLNDGDGLMHNKFVVFDHRNGSPNDADDWVWTGSLNLTSQGAFSDAQNVILVQDAALAEIYTTEFNEMWGSSSNTPNSNNSRFGVNKLDNTPKLLNVRGIPMRAYFSPSDGMIGIFRTEIARADVSIHFCILTFTRDDIASDMQGKWYYTPGFELRGVFDSAQGSDPNSEYPDMIGSGSEPWNPPADVWLDAEAGLLHSKYMLLDVNRAGLDPTLITGSPNWSSNANYDNDENFLVVPDFAVANQYFQDFASRYQIAGGSGDLTVDAPEPAGVADLEPLRVSPNPVAEGITLRFSVPRAGIGEASLYSVDGRHRVTLYRGPIAAGRGEMRFRLDRSAGLGSGVHFIRLEMGDLRLSERVLVLR